MTNLSHGGRLALIRSVLQTTPLHLLHVIHPPKSVLITIERIFNSFFWGSYNGRKHIYWSSWAKTCFPVAEGGLGVRSLAYYVRAFSMKLWWRFRGKSPLWSEYLHGRYCQNLHPTIVPYNRNHSSVWHRLCHIRDVAEPFIFWTLGEGSVSFWHDNWILRIIPMPFAQTICQIPIAAGQGDRIVWTESSTGDFSMKSAWEVIRQASPRRQLLADRNAAKYRGVPFSTDSIILEVQRHLHTLYAAQTLTSTQWNGDLHQAAVMGSYFASKFLEPPVLSDGMRRPHLGLSLIQMAPPLGIQAWQERDQCVGRAHSRLAGDGDPWSCPLVVEVDATTVISLLQSRASGKWVVQHMIMRIVCLQQLLVADVQHVFREANGAADHLAKEAASLQLTRVLHHDDIMGVLRGILCLDRQGVPTFAEGDDGFKAWPSSFFEEILWLALT
ncbi:UNVERIFIED_CONTAM: putative ribonuclease H protein [Sesamum calycinum]|uniref:Ribonuclease H protein n=1 Tax=Sesamum calycinum TaxID=2727403 RepID=A0AAW2JCE1_9LAMI